MWMVLLCFVLSVTKTYDLRFSAGKTEGAECTVQDIIKFQKCKVLQKVT